MSEYDDYLMVESESGKPSLMFSDPKQQARFELGISMLVYSWDALDIAVINQWGGIESAEKRDWITGIIVDLFKNNKAVDSPLLEETLLYAMLDEFDTHVDDGSAQPIANNMIILYDECRQLNYSRVEELYTKWLERQKTGANKERYVEINKVISDSEEDEDMNVEVEQDHIEPASRYEPIIDDDGFEMVQKKGRRRY
ncbi:Tsr2p PWA37_002692 [Arxiozyma heterogenica]|uniref:Pre-rRNA-processing protein TSR2 n=1 Tax=Arxiozyma heterogenica TaxID=278026 RepID=A0AAN8A7A6_9SACH|nr:hypothetical protein RI543_002103 [Kazachstania heterogenica]